MRVSTPSRVALVVVAGVVTAVWAAQSLPFLFPDPERPGESRLNLFRRLELMAYDWRLRLAAERPTTAATNLGFVFISDDSIATVASGALGYRFGLYWPRQLYGRLARELSAQGAKAVAFDILFGERRPDHAPVLLPDQTQVDSDEFFAHQIRAAGGVILAATKDLAPPDLFRTNALALGDISSAKDFDGITRRVRAFVDYHLPHPLLRQAARLEPSEAAFLLQDGSEWIVPIDAAGFFEVAHLPAVLRQGASGKRPAVETVRVWNLGIQLAALGLEADLSRAVVDLRQGRIVLPGRDGQRRVLPVDAYGRLHLDWSMRVNDPRLTKEEFTSLLELDAVRQGTAQGELTNRWQGKLVVVASTASGNDLTDRGATPLEEDTFLAGAYWNVANSIITGRLIRPYGFLTESLMILGMGLLAAALSWRLPPLAASACVLGVGLAYVAGAVALFLAGRLWLPLVLPLGGAFLMTHACLVTYRVRLEHAGRRHVLGVFRHVVSPEVVNELLRAERIALGGTRRPVTILFADIRGFTAFTDQNEGGAGNADGAAREAADPGQRASDEAAQEILATVNLYVGAVAETVKGLGGTLDKYIGDCVMAFWGAPIPDRLHAAHAVQAAIEAQRRIARLNAEREAENERRRHAQAESQTASAAGPPLLPLLGLGMGLNTGTVTVGLMGSGIMNYTVFGREVNLASRLEGISARGRITIGQATYADLTRGDPGLAARCSPLEPVKVKGFRDPVPVYEVRWDDAPAR